mmetsp:Transcript_16177/g.22429  ORF Transcript_16177/g.22429 Transcript_16177/m.22429 type:complete len:274 (-) Transcript_16177:62-883(-)|eukprot:CAMPEP_0201490404 /NCGR_PEP_ID=MMETSP0151_2-20130828/26535_1 /ASSEMBLY_ACC=CAM_ASM_000257 /TAXON_ID=200890 /ORGANISM="Paramoeba atlantica, Strain 621/1 / CCAP 1560/9" /LENGTH=273 /DNA_ID=CAMNT_0047876367 /DNA_START=71 /DNA_END=892 /DNA_ORIENTATION=+
MNVNKLLDATMKIAGAGLTVALLGNQATFVVEPGHSGVVFDRFQGVKEKVYGEGLHFVVPFLQWPIIYDTRITPSLHRTETASKDLQTIRLFVRLLHQPVVEKLPWIFSQVGTDYAERILPSIGNEVLKAVVAEFDADELVTQREAVSCDIRDRLIKRAEHYNIILRDVSITKLEFSPEYTAAIERKQVEQQIAERQKFIVEKSKQEKLAAVIRVEGETEAGRLLSEAMKISPEFLELRKIEAAKKIAEYLARSQRVVYLPNNGGNLLLNIPN